MLDVTVSDRQMRVLDFDIECRPIAWYGGDFVTKQPTAIAWKFIGERGRLQVALIGESDRSSLVIEEETAMIMAFRRAYDAADMVTGHFIRGFDLPVLNGACMRLGLPMLGEKLTQDTKLDLAKRSGMSTSQENLGAMFELAHPKVGMNTSLWAAGNMLLPHGIAATKKRVKGDVRQHIELREKMLEAGVLAQPRNWLPGGLGVGNYHS
jgi:DNA polymerase elongation subunit (family B)